MLSSVTRIMRLCQCATLLLVLATAANGEDDESGGTTCEPITIPMCQNIGYTMTGRQNLFGNLDQAAAAKELSAFETLISTGCSKHLTFFLCSLYVPMCSERSPTGPVSSCQSVCLNVQQSCLPILEQLNLKWPEALNCSRLSDLDNGVCMQAPPETEPKPLVPKPTIEFIHPIRSSNTSLIDESSVYESSCPVFLVEVPTANGAHCAGRCGVDWYFTRAAKNTAQILLGISAAICFMATLFAIPTFWLDDTMRFQYPARPIIYVSLCCLIVSVAFLFRAVVGADAVSCDKQIDGSIQSHIVVEGLRSSGCVFVFLLTYYFGTAAVCWWVVLCACWYLSAVQRKNHASIDNISKIFHIFGWTLPGLLTTLAAVRRQLDGDELTGMCSVGNNDRTALLIFNIIPTAFLISFGLILLVFGYLGFSKLQAEYRVEGRDATKQEQIINRVGSFGGLCLIPWLVFLGCLVYEYMERPRWYREAVSRAMDCSGPWRGYHYCPLEQSIPSVGILLLKTVMILLLGVCTGIWVWGDVTSSMWSQYIPGMRCRKRPPAKRPLELLTAQYTHQSPVLQLPYAATARLCDLSDISPYRWQVVPAPPFNNADRTYIACV